MSESGHAPLQSPHALTVSVPEQFTSYEQARSVAAAIEPAIRGTSADSRIPSRRPGTGTGPADAYILATWGQLRPPRPKRQRTASPRQRQLTATDPHPGSLLTPIGDPYRNPDSPSEIVRDYRCACGTAKKVTAVQAQVTSGNTRSCGHLRNQTKRQKRRVISPAETQAAREGRAERDGARRQRASPGPHHRVLPATPGRTPGDSRGYGFLEEKRVREWAQQMPGPWRLAVECPAASGSTSPKTTWHNTSRTEANLAIIGTQIEYERPRNRFAVRAAR